MVITIARECGCEGDEVGRKLSEIYGIPCYSKKELIELAKEKKVYDKYPFYFGERQVDDMMSMVADDMNLKVRETPKKVLSALFGDQPCIVIGRASDYAYKEHPDAVRIFLCGDKKTRIEKIAKKHQVSESKAKMIHDILYNEQQSYKTVIFLQDLGFSMSESVKIYETYKEKTIDILEDNMYDLLDKIKGIGFLTVDRIALKQMDRIDERRINAGIIYSMNEVCMETGNTYLTFDEILIKTSYILKIELTSEELEYYVLKLNKLNKIVIIDNKYILKNMYDLETSITAKIAK